MNVPKPYLASPTTVSRDDPLLRALVTAVPQHILTQDYVRENAKAFFGPRSTLFEHLEPVFGNAQIRTRFACQPPDWYLTPRDFGEKSARFAEHATALGLDVATAALAQAQMEAGDIDAIVAVSTTGVMTPTLDARLMNLLPFRRDIIRLPIFGFGCAGGVLGLTRAAQLARSRPGMRVLVIVVELCTMAIRHDRMTPSNIVATALFGDGAAGAILEWPSQVGEGDGAAFGTVGIGGEHTWKNSLDIMGWRIDSLGLDVVFSHSIPTVVVEDYPAALDGFLARNGIAADDIVRSCCHPGGVKVIEALEQVLGLSSGALDIEREVLRDYGNMSAPSVLFVLDRIRRRGITGPVLMSSLGPGFSAAFQIVNFTGRA
jgi:alkylresorcinol/alkylpyrone synthase